MTVDEHAKFDQAVSAARQFLAEMRTKPGLSMILRACAVPGDARRSGYGCGKTTLAKIIHHQNMVMQFAPGAPESLTVKSRGLYLEARQAMDLFSSGKFAPHQIFAAFGNLVVLDDVGREGSIRYEKRDVEAQMAEKRARYYNIIDWCYSQKISVIMTCNMHAAELAQLLHGASWSRLLEMAPDRYRLDMTGIQDMRPLLAAD